MNILCQLKKTGSVVVALFLCLGSSAVSAQQDPKVVPKSSAVATAPAAGTWTYNTPDPGAPDTPKTTPTIDKAGSVYLPFLPWTGQNVALLANYADFFYQLEKNNTTSETTWAYEADLTMTGNNILSQTQDSNMKEVHKNTTTQFQSLLTYTPNAALMAQNATMPGTDICAANSPNPDCKNPTDNAFNANNLLNVTGFAAAPISKEGDPELPNSDITTLISFLANLSTTFPDPGFDTHSDPKARAEFLKNQDVRAYILATRTLASLQSMALSNFNLLAQERVIKTDLGKNIKMVDVSTISVEPNAPEPKPVKDASQLQVEKYLIDRRLSNPKWYAAMNTATPIGLQRETVFVLAEMQRQIYELRMVNERMLATLSTMQMAMLQMSMPQVKVMAQNISNPPTELTAPTITPTP